MNQESKINIQEENKKIDYLEIISLLWSKRKFIIIVTFIFTAVISGLTFLITPTYLSSASILPEMDKGKLGPLGDLAALAGINVGGEVIMVKLYPDILKSEAVLKKIIEKKYNSKYFNHPVDLYEFFGIEEDTPRRTLEVILKKMRNLLDIDLSQKTGLLTYSIETKDPQVSADILNNLTESLNNFLLTKRTSNATEQRKWIERRLEEVKNDLIKAENELKNFREKNRRVTDSPQLLLEQERLVREVTLQTTVFATLKQQHEVAKIEEIKSVPIINVLDEAKPAAKRNSPKRRVFALVGFLIGFTFACVYTVIKSKYMGYISPYLNIFKKKKYLN